MDTASSRVHDPLETQFSDGLGIRRRRDSADGPLDVLLLHERLTSVPTFEFLVRERINRLAHFRHNCYARVHDVERAWYGTSTLAIVSDAAVGTRLSQLLASADQHLLPLDLEAALYVIRQLVSAVALMHDAVPDVCHGAIGPERIVVMPDGKIVVVDYVLGAALEQLKLSPEQYWKELRIALPADQNAPRFNRRSDVVQVGATALSLLLNRPIDDEEYPSKVRALATETLGLGGGFEPMPEWLSTWLSRALLLDPAHSFASAAEAKKSFEAGLASSGRSSSQKALVSFFAECTRAEAAAAASPSTATADAVPSQGADEPVASAETVPFDAAQNTEPGDEPDSRLKLPALTGHRLRIVAAVALLVALTSGGVMAARRYLASADVAAPATGTLAVDTNPSGVKVVIDGEARGNTPLRATLKAGAHTLDLSADGVHRTISVTIAPNTETSQFIEMPKAAPAAGELEVRSEPAGAQVSVDGQARGIAPLTISGLAPGNHVVTLKNDMGSARENVTIEAGATASLVVPMKSETDAPESGWISISAPAEIQIFEDQKLLGSSRTDRIMVAVGRHALELSNDALGYRSSQTIQVAPGQVAKVKVDWPQGTIAINAVPWANVWLDGQELGETPVGNTKVAIGTHEIIFRHPQLGEQRFNATVTAATPTRLSIDMRKK